MSVRVKLTTNTYKARLTGGAVRATLKSPSVRVKLGTVKIPAGAGSDANFVHVQGSSLAVWTITHNLGKYPAVSVFDPAGDQFYGTVRHLDVNSLTITFKTPQAGTATLN